MLKKRIVIKIGTSSLTYENGRLNIRKIDIFCRIISDLSNSGQEIILVTSGAVGVGMSKLLLKKRPSTTIERQAIAAVGQCELMSIYSKLFSAYNTKVGQVLLTRDVIEQPDTKKNVINTFDALINMGIIPIVNENDTVSTDELEGSNFGDNDTLSAIVASLVHADLLMILTDIDGLYDKDPRSNKDAKKISVVNKVDDHIKKIAGGSGSNRGTGGMTTKVLAVEFANNRGIDCCIMSGDDPEKIYYFLDGEAIGTFFKAKN